MLIQWLRKHGFAIAITCLLAVAIVMGWMIWSRRYCACLNMASTVKAIQALSRPNWRDLDRSAVAKAWPGVPTLPCEQTSASGLEAFVAGIERCCRTCGTCGGPYLLEDGDPSVKGLWAIGVTLCRSSSAKALGDLRRLVEAAVPPKPEAAFDYGGWNAEPDTESVRHYYRWRSGDDTFILEARAVADGIRWIGEFEVTRCAPIRAAEQWKLEDGSVVEVLRSEVTDDNAKARRDFAFSYLSRCLLADTACREAEEQRLWPRVQALAESQGASAVYFSAEDCKHASVGASAHRKADGQWDVPWSRCETPGAK